ncbi:MAG: hypothetical protein ACJ76H_06760 [Bacteriovoracaceae bacterium]
MKWMTLPLLAGFILAGCSSGDTVTRELQSQSKPAEIANPQAQYRQAIDMVSKSPDFSENQKRKLVELIGDYAIKGQEMRIQQSQFRSLLISEKMEPQAAGASTKKSLANVSLQRLNALKTKNLEDFLNEFKKITGDEGRHHQALLLQTIDMY